MRVFITIRQKINHAIFYIRHMKAEFDHWASLPKLFGPILIIGWLAIFMTSWDMGYEAAELSEKIGIQRSIAGAFEGAPAVMLQQIEAKKDTMSPYQYELKKAQQEFFAREAPKIAERIKSDAYWKIFVGVSKVATEQAAQMATGKLAGRAANYVGTRVGYQATKVGAKLAATRFRAAGRFIGSKGEELIWKSAQLGELADKSSNLIWELITAAARVDPATTPTLQKAMSKPEFAELFQLLQKATEKDPDKLMEAHLYHDIKWLEKNIFDADRYREFVIAMANKYKNLTKEFGSSDSMWNDVEELAKWFANKVGRPLPDEPKPDEPEPEPEQETQFIEFPDRSGNYQIRLTFPNGECKVYDTFELEGQFITNLHLENAKSGQSTVKVKVEVIDVAVNIWRLYYRPNMWGTKEINKTMKDYSETTTEFNNFNIGPVDKADGEYGHFYVIHIDESPPGVAVFVFTIPK